MSPLSSWYSCWNSVRQSYTLSPGHFNLQYRKAPAEDYENLTLSTITDCYFCSQVLNFLPIWNPNRKAAVTNKAKNSIMNSFLQLVNLLTTNLPLQSSACAKASPGCIRLPTVYRWVTWSISAITDSSWLFKLKNFKLPLILWQSKPMIQLASAI